MLHLTVTRPAHDTARIALRGELDRDGIGALTRLAGALAPQRVQRVAFDLGGLEFVDLAGWRALEAARAELAGRGLDTDVEHAPRLVQRVRSLFTA